MNSRKVSSFLIIITLILVPIGWNNSPPTNIIIDKTNIYDIERKVNLTSETTELPLYPLAHNFQSQSWINSDYYRISEDNALETNYGERYDNAGWKYSPVAASQFCYTAYNEYILTGNETLKTHVIQQSEGLLSRSEQNGGGLLWRYNFSQATFGAEPGWISGMAQGLAMACFSGAYLITENQSFADAAYKAYIGLNAPFGDNGTRIDLNEDAVFFEEVAGKGSDPSQILNGMIYALGGLWLSNEASQNEEYITSLEKGITGVKILLDNYDAGGSSLYDLGPKRIARLGTNYNLVHVAQMQWLYDLTGDVVFLEKALQFLSYERALNYNVTASNFIDNRGPENLRGFGSYFSVPTNEEVNLSFNFSKQVSIDQINIISYSNSTIPESAYLSVEDNLDKLEFKERFETFKINPVETSGISIRLVPPEGGRIALFLISFSSIETRMLTTISSDLSIYWQPGESKPKSEPAKWSTLNLNDENNDSIWTTEHNNPWLLIWIEEFEKGEIYLESCFNQSLGNFSISESKNLINWRNISTVNTKFIPVSSEAKYFLIEWKENSACLADMTYISK
jgi:hypothetical protein